MTQKLDSIKRKVKNKISIKKPVGYPVLYGELLKGRTAFITGGSSGIGFAIAESFIRNGANVIICGRNKEKLESAKKKLSRNASAGQVIETVVMDISKTKEIEKELKTFIQERKSIDILVNNAGVSTGANIGATEVDDYENLMKTNLEGAYFVSQFFLNYMKKNKISGNILNIASASSLRPANSPYILAKWGIAGLTKGLAKTAIKDDIVVNGLAPGPTATPMLAKNAEDISHHTNPSGRFAMPEEIADLATVLVSDLGRLIVGDTLYATGGAGIITYDDMEY